MIRKHKRVFEDVQLTPIENQQENQQQNNTTINNNNQNQQQNATQTQKQTLKPEDVDNMSDDEVINCVYFEIPDDIDITTKNKLYQRADEIRRNRESGLINGKDAETMARGVIRDAQKFLNDKSAFKF